MLPLQTAAAESNRSFPTQQEPSAVYPDPWQERLLSHSVFLGSFGHDLVILGSGVQAHTDTIGRVKEEVGVILWEKKKLCVAVTAERSKPQGAWSQVFQLSSLPQWPTHGHELCFHVASG